MKSIIFSLAMALSSLMAAAKCSQSDLSIWPTRSTIQQNSIFMLEGYAQSKMIIQGLNKDYAIYLQSGNKKIKLLVKKTFTSQYFLQQAFLVPEEKLQAGLEYTLHIDNLPEHERAPDKWNAVTQNYEPCKWKVESGNDQVAPEWIKKPKETKKELVHYGCGPGIFVHFGSSIKESSEMMVRVTLTATRTGDTAMYCVPVDEKGKISLGHGMCSGAFSFSEKEYEASFDLVDASGNITPWTGSKIKFTPPTGETPTE